MHDDFLPFSRPSIAEAAIQEVVDCLRSGWITTGPRVQQFTQDLQHYLQAPHVLALSSATAGLHLSLLSLKLQPGDEVITTSMTFAATLNTIVLAGAKPVLVDVDLDTYNFNIDKVAAAITNKTRAIIPVHFAGLPVDLDPLYELAEQHRLRIIEDAAHAIGAHYKNNIIGSFGDTQVFSFHPNKNMTTGEGGAVTTSDAELAKNISILRFHGIDRSNAWDRYSKTGKQQLDVVAPGLKYNMLDMQAALGIHQLQALDDFILRRTRLVERYISAFADWPELSLPQMPNYNFKHAWHLFAPLINADIAGLSRDEFIQTMKEYNIGTGLHYQAPYLFSYYREHYGFKAGDFPNADRIASSIVSLPLFPDMTTTEQDRVITTMAKIFKRRTNV